MFGGISQTFGYIKPTFAMYFLQILQGKFSGVPLLIAFLNLFRPSMFL